MLFIWCVLLHLFQFNRSTLCVCVCVGVWVSVKCITSHQVQPFDGREYSFDFSSSVFFSLPIFFSFIVCCFVRSYSATKVHQFVWISSLFGLLFVFRIAYSYFRIRIDCISVEIEMYLSIVAASSVLVCVFFCLFLSIISFILFLST